MLDKLELVDIFKDLDLFCFVYLIFPKGVLLWYQYLVLTF